MIGIARVSVRQMDDSASDEAIFLKYMVHDDVVSVGVYAYASGLRESPVKEPAGCIVSGFVHSYPVDDMIRGVIGPASVVYGRICRVRSRYESHCGDDPAVLA